MKVGACICIVLLISLVTIVSVLNQGIHFPVVPNDPSYPVKSATTQPKHAPAGQQANLLAVGRVAQVANLLQLHHGTYRVDDIATGVRFAYKTECRPAQKWHGQQGWGEVAAYQFAQLFFEEKSTVPVARGIEVTVELSQRANLHRDGCGIIKSDTVLTLIGAALEWQPALHERTPPKSLLRHFGAVSMHSGTPRLAPRDSQKIAEISDILVLDYILENEDREDKNWFLINGTYRAIDNGWAFSGRNYAEPICSNYSSFLRCPHLLRFLTGNSNCRAKEDRQQYYFCRFRNDTVGRLRRFRKAWESSLGAVWKQQLAADPLFQWLVTAFASSTSAPSKKRVSAVALARDITGCPPLSLEDLLVDGISLRLASLERHIEQCEKKFGAASVLLDII